MMNVTWIDSLRLRAHGGHIKNGWAAHSRPGVAFHDLPQATIRARIAGSRNAGSPAVVMVCDPPNVIEHFDALVGLIEPHHRIICFEPPGFGFSFPQPSFRFTFDEYLACIEDLLITLDEGPYLLAFTCVWAHIALQIAARKPAIVARLLLWQCPCWEHQVNWAKRVDKKNILSRPVMGQLAMAWGVEKIGLEWYKAALAQNRHTDFMPTLRQALDHGAFCCLGSLWQQWFCGYAPPSVLVRQPTLVTWGMADRTHSGSDRFSISGQISHPKWHGFNQAGHSPELEISEEYFALLHDWAKAA